MFWEAAVFLVCQLVYSCLSILDCPLWNCWAEGQLCQYQSGGNMIQEVPECFGSLQLEQFFCPQGLEVLHPGSGH